MDQNIDPRYRRAPMNKTRGQRVFLGFLIAFAAVFLLRQIGLLPIDINALLARTCG